MDYFFIFLFFERKATGDISDISEATVWGRRVLQLSGGKRWHCLDGDNMGKHIIYFCCHSKILLLNSLLFHYFTTPPFLFSSTSTPKLLSPKLTSLFNTWNQNMSFILLSYYFRFQDIHPSLLFCFLNSCMYLLTCVSIYTQKNTFNHFFKYKVSICSYSHLLLFILKIIVQYDFFSYPSK